MQPPGCQGGATGAQLEGGMGGRPPLPFFENEKKYPDFLKKKP